MVMKAIITGLIGQDGYYMAQKLLGNGFEVLGLMTSMENAQKSEFINGLGRLRWVR